MGLDRGVVFMGYSLVQIQKVQWRWWSKMTGLVKAGMVDEGGGGGLGVGREYIGLCEAHGGTSTGVDLGGCAVLLATGD